METILGLLISYFALSYTYTLVMTIASFYFKDVDATKTKQRKTFAIVIPAYKEDVVIKETVLTAVHQNYPSDLFTVYVIADQLKESTIKLISELGAVIVNVEFEKSTKVKSLKKYAEVYGNQAEYTILLDADNCIEPTFLTDINDKISSNNSEVIQVQRKSKNYKSAISFLDAFSEFANTAILSKGPNKLNLSSKLSGSGMILKSTVFTELISTMNGISGFDKEMELKLTKDKVFIKYYDAPYVLDEKLENANQIKTQRSRWIYAQFDYLRKYFKSGTKALFTGKLDHAHKVFQLALPPRVLGLIFLIVINVFSFIFSSSKMVLSINILADVLFICSYFILFIQFIKNHKIPKGLFIEIFKVIAGYIYSIKNLKKAGKEFLHTNHNI